MISPRTGVLPGFRLSLATTALWLGLLVVVPLGALVARATQMPARALVHALLDPRSLAAFRLSFGAALAAGLLDVAIGLLVAWVLARYRFPGKALASALVDVPFALPTAVAGIALTTLYAPNGLLGAPLARVGIKVAFTPLGVVIALTFIGLPFVVRTVEPVLLALDPSVEEAAATLGATRAHTIRRVVLPALYPALSTGFVLAFGRALGEYGSIVFISGNVPGKTEIVPLLIVTRLEQYDYVGATAIGATMLAASFVILFAVHSLEGRASRRRSA